MHLVLFVLIEPEKLDDLFEAWEAAGVSGVTVLSSTGLGHLPYNAILKDRIQFILKT